jgi:hypothetical protein
MSMFRRKKRLQSAASSSPSSHPLVDNWTPTPISTIWPTSESPSEQHHTAHPDTQAPSPEPTHHQPDPSPSPSYDSSPPSHDSGSSTYSDSGSSYSDAGSSSSGGGDF